MIRSIGGWVSPPRSMVIHFLMRRPMFDPCLPIGGVHWYNDVNNIGFVSFSSG